MKKTMSRSIISLILAAAFLLGLGFLCAKYILDADLWAAQSYNPYMVSGQGLSNAGDILDRNGVVLATSIDGERTYHEDESTRKAMLHTVGDGSYNIATAVETAYRDKISGHSKVFGYGLPASLKGKNNLTVTLDSEVCTEVYEAFEGKKGACFVYNYKTGEVLCMVSAPTYDPMNIPEEIEDGSYLNNCISSTYTPGSIFKIITAGAGFEHINGYENKEFTCESVKEIGNFEVTCLEKHGTLGIHDAFAYSCNIAFGDTALEAGRENMQKTADKMGINRSFRIGEVYTAKGNYDVKKADDISLAWSGIGQYTDTVNPAQMAILCGAIAQDGETRLPHYVKGENSGKSGKLMSKEVANHLDNLMRYTISDYYGDSMFEGLTVCAKTGTAEVGKDKLPNGWMVGYSLDEDAPLAFAVVVEEGDYGFYSAGPIARIAMLGSADALRNN
ncbi:MAG: penicillin-binding protein [Clostridia bacterium]|nr:penicillin-binding protein [Clostridia bacterium]